MATSLAGQQPFTLEEAPRIPARGGSTRIRRFDGLTRRTADWDGLLKDTQLWFDDADCFVHFCGHSTSQRGPSLKVPSEAIEKLECAYLMTECLHTSSSVSRSAGNGCGSTLSTISEAETAAYELYIPSPPGLSRDEVFLYHLTTRNVLAYAVGRSVVGEKLSLALSGLWRRLREWVPRAASISEFTSYLEKQGYLSFAENSEHALACLKFAESARARDIWIDAFSHCVGMHERLYLSPEFAGLSNTTTALIVRASLEMDLHIVRVVRAVGAFLEEQLGTEHLGLSKPARDHLDHFRSFLHAFYVDKLGYFPPSDSTTWHKSPWPAMHTDFQSLYEYLVDANPSSDSSSSQSLTGGVCVVQNVQAFDLRHGYEPLPNILPLLPQKQLWSRASLSSQRGIRTFKLGRTNPNPETKITASQALANATNPLKGDVLLSPLVQEYQRYERQKLDSKMDVAEARKIRWLLIYGVLQMLNSIVKAPKEVRDTKTNYPLCILTTGFPAWVESEDSIEYDLEDSTPSPTSASLVPDALDALEGRSSRISIHPDCEADSAEDFFAANTISRHNSLNAAPSPHRLSTQLAKTVAIRSSMHSSVQSLHRSVVGSLSRRSSLRRDSDRQEPRKKPSYCEIVVKDYGNGMHWEDIYGRPQTAFRSEDLHTAGAKNPFLEFDFGIPALNGEPTLEDCQLGDTHDSFAEAIEMSPRESNFSIASEDLIDSSRSSYLSEVNGEDTDLSSWDGDDYDGAVDDQSNASTTPKEPSRHRQPTTPSRQLCYRPSNPTLGAKPSSVNINGGCYTPTGMISPPVSKFSAQRVLSEEATDSETSSIYPDESNQAADIQEAETRGRQISNALGQLAPASAVAEV